MNSLPFGQLKSFLKILIGVQYDIQNMQDPILLLFSRGMGSFSIPEKRSYRNQPLSSFRSFSARSGFSSSRMMVRFWGSCFTYLATMG